MWSRQHSPRQALGSPPPLARGLSLLMAQDLICEHGSKGFPPTGSNMRINRAKLWASVVQAGMQGEKHVVLVCITHLNLPCSFSLQSHISCPNLIHNVGFVLLNSFSVVAPQWWANWFLYERPDSAFGYVQCFHWSEMGVAGVSRNNWWRVRHRCKAQRADCSSVLPSSASEWKWGRYLLLLPPQIFTHSNNNSAFSAVAKITYSLGKDCTTVHNHLCNSTSLQGARNKSNIRGKAKYKLLLTTCTAWQQHYTTITGLIKEHQSQLTCFIGFKAEWMKNINV